MEMSIFTSVGSLISLILCQKFYQHLTFVCSAICLLVRMCNGKTPREFPLRPLWSMWHSGSVRDSQPARPGSLPEGVSHCVIEAGEMCRLTVALTSGRLVH